MENKNYRARQFIVTAKINDYYLNTQAKVFNFKSLLNQDANFNDEDFKIASQIQAMLKNHQFKMITKREWLQFEYYRLKLSIIKHTKNDIQNQLNQLQFIGHANVDHGKLLLTMVVRFNKPKSVSMVRSGLGIMNYNLATFEGKYSINFEHDNKRFLALTQLIQHNDDIESSFKVTSNDADFDLLDKLSFYIKSNAFVINTPIKPSFDWHNTTVDDSNLSCLAKLSKNDYQLASELFSAKDLASFKVMNQLINNHDYINPDYYMLYLYACIKLNYFISKFKYAKNTYVDPDLNRSLEIEKRRQHSLQLAKSIQITGAIFNNNRLFLSLNFPEKTAMDMVHKYSNVEFPNITPKYYEQSLHDEIANLSSLPEYQPGKNKTFS